MLEKLTLPKLVVFDMDGTLVNNYEFHLQAWEAVCAEEGHPRTRAEIVRDLHGTNEEICRVFFGELSREASDRIAERKEALYREIYEPFLAPLDGLIPLLDRLQAAGTRCALGTMGNRDNTQFVLDGLGLHPYMHAVTTAEEVRQGKPHPEVFLLSKEKAMPRSVLTTQEFWVFEDTSSGVAAGVAAGATVLGMRTSKTHEELSSHGATRTFTDFTEVLKSID